MKRKIFARLLACLLAVLLPVSALAANPTVGLLENAKANNKEVVATVTFVPGAGMAALGLDADTTTAINDLCGALAMRLTKQPGGLGQFALALSGEDVFSALLRVDSEGFFVQTETVGAEAMYFAFEDIPALMERALSASGMSEDEISKMMGSFTQGFSKGLSAGMSTGMSEKPTREEIETSIITALNGDASLVNWMKDLQARAVVTTGEFASDEHDTADTKTELTLTQEDIAKVLDMPFVKENLEKQYAASGKDAATVADELAEAKEKLLAMQLSIPITCLTKSDAGLVCMDIPLTAVYTHEAETATTSDATATTVTSTTSLTTEAKTETYNISMPMHYDRKTTDAGTAYHATASAIRNDETSATMEIAATRNEGAIDATVTVTDGKQTVCVMGLNYAPSETGSVATLGIDAYNEGKSSFGMLFTLAQTAGENVADTQLSVALGTNMESLKGNTDMTLLSINTHLALQEPGTTFDGIKTATPESSVRVATMTDDELTSFGSTAGANALTTLATLFTKLPESFTNLLMGAM